MGETLRNFDLQEKDLVIADRIYATPTGMAYCLERGADFILRVRRGAFTLLDENGKAMELYSNVINFSKNPLCHCVTSPPKGETQRRKAYHILFTRP